MSETNTRALESFTGADLEPYIHEVGLAKIDLLDVTSNHLQADINRSNELLRFIDREHYGIEIAPWINPITPKSHGFNCLTLDVFDKNTLVSKAMADPNIPDGCLNLIEDVDFIGSACDIDSIVSSKCVLGSFDYIISSHNFEHLPNPILFLQGCSKVLKPNGILSMALPDKRASFDYFRPHSITADWVAAYYEKRDRPSAQQLFAQTSLHSRFQQADREALCFSLGADPELVVPFETLKEAFHTWDNFQKSPDEIYRDVHCSVFTPSSFELILRDCEFLGLVDFDIRSISQNNGNEFYVHLENVAGTIRKRQTEREFYDRRKILLQKIGSEIAIDTTLSTAYSRLVRSLSNLNDQQAVRLEALEEQIVRLRKKTSKFNPFRWLARYGIQGVVRD
ncbi:class I SAM-dependent methyltransferase [Methylocystis sp. MJC1]|uniref:methyltransferase domain-containing protein n=1 Tax=Methylocystis sp. MJC1 TaxID=2654282 RepID=UPI0013EC5F77|nr:methyltransferase domain-containing protein [Methylocystis sp. MJC1]KAF2990050.1 hypothetical protein MJC1_02967 [Methylocystis sp. MJC1]MBU6528750.1 methyltransferase domain-containing protein [Methylocystis sp. MJC1]UZX11636.1 class I SAM-dependent methyltransferase [Methylocystis sp. MJC1]